MASDHRRSPKLHPHPARASSTAVESHEQEQIARRAPAPERDPEDTATPYDARSDPYALSKSLKSESEIGSTAGRKLRHFYSNQNDNIKRLLKDVETHRQEAKAEQEENSFHYKTAVLASLIANFGLAGLQLYGAISSGSLSLFTTLADALFDPLSNVMLFVVHSAVKKVNAREYPSGKARIENAGNISFCFLMFSVSVSGGSWDSPGVGAWANVSHRWS